MFRWLLGSSSNKFYRTEVLIDSFLMERFLIFPQRLGIFSWNQGNTNKISWETIWHSLPPPQPFPKLKSEIWCMCKLQFLDTIHNLSAKFHMEEISSYHFLNFPLWPWQVKLIGDVINLIMWLYLTKGYWIINYTLTINSTCDHSDDIIYCLLLSIVITGASLNFIPCPPIQGSPLGSGQYGGTIAFLVKK